MEQLCLSFRTLAGVSTSYNIVIGSDNNAQQAVKIISSEDFDFYKKLERKHKKKKKKRTKKRTETVSLEIDEFPEPPDIIHKKPEQLVDSKDYAIFQSPATSKRKSKELADAIKDGIKKFGDNNDAIKYGFSVVEGKEEKFLKKKKKESEKVDATYM